MIETRRLTSEEFKQLITEAPETETVNLRRILGNEAYVFFDIHALDHFGLFSDGRPIYMVALTQMNGHKELWTVVNSDVREQFSLFKHCKRTLKHWLDKYKEIYATMDKMNPKNIAWTKRLGFRVIEETDQTILFKIGG